MTDRLRLYSDALVRQIMAGESFSAPWDDGDEPTLEEGYQLQEVVFAALEPERGGLAGYKVAVTTASLQRMLSIDHPLAGRIHAGQVYESGVTLPRGRLITPAVECELVIRIGSDVPNPSGDLDQDAISDHVGEVIVGFEIIDARGEGLDAVGAHGLVADRCAFEGVVLGDRVADWSALDLSACPASLAWGNDAEPAGGLTEQGNTGAAMGHPFAGVAWISNHLAQRGQILRAGDLVLTGSLFAPRPAQTGDHFTFTVEGLGEVEAGFD